MQEAMSDKRKTLRAKSDAADRPEMGSLSDCGGTGASASLLVGHRVTRLCSLLAPSHRARGARNGDTFLGPAGH